MSGTLILFILIQLIAFVFFIETLRRVSTKALEYGLKDTVKTLPFGLVRLRHVVILYVISYLIWIVASVFMYLLFISPDASTIERLPRGGGLELHL